MTPTSTDRPPAVVAAELQAASEEKLAGWRRSREAKEATEKGILEVNVERIREALEGGGRATVTVRSRESGKHATIRLVAKKRKSGRGWISRATIAGRVGIGEADAIFAEDPGLEYPENRVGSFFFRSGEWRADTGADPARAWSAEKTVLAVLGTFDGLEKQAELALSAECCYCGRALTDPESIDELTGPECRGRRTKSRAAERAA